MLIKYNGEKIYVKCDFCQYEYSVKCRNYITKKHHYHRSCAQKLKILKGEYDYSYRKTKEYRENMREIMQKSQAWKKAQPIRNKALKEYWKRIRGGKELHEVFSEWQLYRKTVYKITEITYRKFKQIINLNNFQRGRGKYHLDHKFSILEGFKNNIPPYVIAHQSNLQMLKESINIAKDYKCDINMMQLFGGVFADSGKV